MTRPFRLEEDERRYFALRSEFFIALVSSGCPAQVVHTVMRNFGKLEDMAFFEGVRQGMAASVLAPAVDTQAKWFDMHPFDVHAAVYGAESATPLVRAERELIATSGSEHGYGISWLDQEPVRFAPTTLTEAVALYGPDLEVTRPARASRAPSNEPDDVRLDDLPGDADASDDGFSTPLSDEEMEALNRGEPIVSPIEIHPDLTADPEPAERPELLDRIREFLLDTTQKPSSWQELVLMCQRHFKIDAGHLDQVLSTPMGMTVISQAELFHLHPGSLEGVAFLTKP